MEESKFVRQVRMVSGGFPQGFRQCYICQAADGLIEEEGDDEGIPETTS